MKKPQNGGLLVVIEGIDGAGKTTLRASLARRLRSEGREVVETKEPTDGPIGQRIRRLAREGRGTVTPLEELELFLEDRAHHVQEVVLPALGRGAVVLQDRSYFSTVAYQGGRGLDRALILARSQQVAPEPDLLLVLDLTPETSLSRIARRGATDDFETLAELTRVREVFRSFPEARLVDASRAEDAVFLEAWAYIEDRLSWDRR